VRVVKLTIAFSVAKMAIIFDAFSPMSLTGINEIKHLSVIFIYIKFLTLITTPPNIQLLKGTVIPAIRNREIWLIGTLQTCLSSSSRSVMEIERMFPGNRLQYHVVCLEISMFSISFSAKDNISLQALCQICVGCPE
jgi:hypothetical protein